MKILKNNVKWLEEREKRLGYLKKFIRPGKIVEFGWGSGMVLEFLSNKFPKSIVIGIDKSKERLEEVVKKWLKNVIPILADITNPIFPNRFFDTAIFIASLHEVFSYQGREKLALALSIAHDVLRDDGILIIQDFLKPLPKSVEIGFSNTETHKKFLRFAAEFKARKIHFQKTANGVRLDITDAIEFISKYHSPNEADWKEEMLETHFFFTEKDYEAIAKRTGFTIINSTKLSRQQEWWSDVRKDIEFTFEAEYRLIQLILKKQIKWRN